MAAHVNADPELSASLVLAHSKLSSLYESASLDLPQILAQACMRNYGLKTDAPNLLVDRVR